MPPPSKLTEAFVALPPGGGVDIDLIRRNAASCQHAAFCREGEGWLVLARKGWTVAPVRILVGPGLEDELLLPEERPKPRTRAVARVPDAPDAPGADKAPPETRPGLLLRCGF